VRTLRSICLLLLALAPACKVVDARAYNVRELHEEDGRHKRIAVQMSDFEYVFRFGFAGLIQRDSEQTTAKEPERIKDPLSVCVDNLQALSECDSSDTKIGAIQIETYARLAALDPWQISRQYCLHELGKAGERLKLAEHPWVEPVVPAATPEAVRDALSGLMQALARPEAGISLPELQPACAAMTALNLDLDGARRALSAAALLLERQGRRSPNRVELGRLVLELERRVIHLSLARGASDASPYVRAAAVEASVRALGSERLAREILRLGREDEAEEVHLMVLALLRVRGLPQTSIETGTDPAQSQREGQLELLYDIAVGHPADRVRVSAMSTLGAVSGAGFRSLREEDWETWWEGRNAPAAR